MIRKFATQTKKIGFEENEGFVMVKVFNFFRFAHYIYCKRLSTFDIF